MRRPWRDRVASGSVYKAPLSAALDATRDGLRPFVAGTLARRFGSAWHQHPKVRRMVLGPPYGEEGPTLDAALLLKLLVDSYYWNLLFCDTFRARNRWRIDSLRDLRNRLAHDQGDDPLFQSPQSALGLLESMEILLRAVIHAVEAEQQEVAERQAVVTNPAAGQNSAPQGGSASAPPGSAEAESAIVPQNSATLEQAKASQRQAAAAGLARVQAISRQIAPGLIEHVWRLATFQAPGAKRFWAALLATLGLSALLIDYYRSPRIRAERLVIGTPHQRLDGYRSLEAELERRLKPYRLVDHLRGRRVDVILTNADSYPRAVAELKRLHWDVALAYSPIVSMATLDYGYRPIGVMFPDSKGYTGVMFTRKDSPIRSLSDLKPDSTVALGDYYSATKYFVPMSLLKGRRVTLLPDLEVAEIFDLVRDGKADVGVAARSFEAGQPSDEFNPARAEEGFRVIARGLPLPASVVALSPKLDDGDRRVLARLLMDLPAQLRTRDQANFGPGAIPDYGPMQRLVAEVRAFSACLKLDGSVLSIACPPGLTIVAHDLWIDDVSLAGTSVLLNATSISRRPMAIRIERSLLQQLVSVESPSQLKGRHLQVLLPATAGPGPHPILHPNQIELLN